VLDYLDHLRIAVEITHAESHAVRSCVDSRAYPAIRVMCLLDRVVMWDQQRIQCQANSHRSAITAASRDQLSSACGIEYAAQAMAVHGALLASADSARPRALSGQRARAVLHVPRLDNIAADSTSKRSASTAAAALL